MKGLLRPYARFLACLGRYSRPGTRNWLVEREIWYGGYISTVPRRRISEFDTRSPQHFNSKGMTGGDRMSPRRNNYGHLYARYLSPFLANRSSITLVEVGILRGTGLAIWSDLFPEGRIVGLDIDTSHFNANLEQLIRLGAFKSQNYEVHTFDGFVDNKQQLADILQGDSIDIMIDDASHAEDSIMKTFKSSRQFLAEDFLYVIEDNKDVHHKLMQLYPQYCVDNFGLLTMVKGSD